MAEANTVKFVSEVLLKIKKDNDKHFSDLNNRLDALTKFLETLQTCDNCKQNKPETPNTRFTLYEGYKVVAVDGSVRWFDGFKKGGVASIWGDKSHILNRQKISNLEPLSYIHEL